jgi:hypothetical protein
VYGVWRAEQQQVHAHGGGRNSNACTCSCWSFLPTFDAPIASTPSMSRTRRKKKLMQCLLYVCAILHAWDGYAFMATTTGRVRNSVPSRKAFTHAHPGSSNRKEEKKKLITKFNGASAAPLCYVLNLWKRTSNRELRSSSKDVIQSGGFTMRHRAHEQTIGTWQGSTKNVTREMKQQTSGIVNEPRSAAMHKAQGYIPIPVPRTSAI